MVTEKVECDQMIRKRFFCETYVRAVNLIGKSVLDGWIIDKLAVFKQHMLIDIFSFVTGIFLYPLNIVV